MAPEESLLEILQVLPFCWIKGSRLRNVGSSSHCPMTCPSVSFLYPVLNINELNKFVKSISRDTAHVDLEANPTVGKDQPPNLATFVPSGSTVLSDPPEKVSALQSGSGNCVVANSNSNAVTEKPVKPSNNVLNVEEKSANAKHPSNSFTDAEKFVDEILDRLFAQLLSETKEGSMNQQGEELGTKLANGLKDSCCAELKNLATMLKNTFYAEGFHAGRASSLR